MFCLAAPWIGYLRIGQSHHPKPKCRAPHTGTLEVKEGSHAAHEQYWAEVSTLPPDQKAALGDWYPFKPEVLTRHDHAPKVALTSRRSAFHCPGVVSEDGSSLLSVPDCFGSL